MIEVVELTKYYDHFLAVDHISFTIPHGRVVGFLGPNGAGKSTTLRMLAGILSPSSGSIRIDGINLQEDPLHAKQKMGFMPEQPALYKEMRVEEYLSFVGVLKGLNRLHTKQSVEKAILKAGLTGMERRRMGAISKGYRQRVALAQALIGDPPILLLDEPTAGLDPMQMVEIRKLIQNLKGDHTLFLSTHILSEVTLSCDEVLIIQQGRLVAHQSMAQLGRLEGHGAYLFVFESLPLHLAGIFAQRSGVLEVEEMPLENSLKVKILNQEILQHLLKICVEKNLRLCELRPERDSLEDIFLKVSIQS